MTPPPLDRWIDAVLMLFVSLVRHAASILRMGRIRLPAECHSDVTPAPLPEGKTGTQQQEATLPLEACPLARVPGEGRDPASAQSALATRTVQPVIPAEAHMRAELEPRSRAHGHLRVPPPASDPRMRASGMTMRARLKTA